MIVCLDSNDDDDDDRIQLPALPPINYTCFEWKITHLLAKEMFLWHKDHIICKILRIVSFFPKTINYF